MEVGRLPSSTSASSKTSCSGTRVASSRSRLTSKPGSGRRTRTGGTAQGVPVVFLHGAAGTGLSWIGYAEERGARVAYAIDTISDVGRSRQQVAVEGPDDLAEWLDTTLAALGVEHAHLVGTSYGGFLALNLASRRPSRVQSLVLIDTAGVLRISIAKFLLWGMPVLFASLLPDRPRAWAAKRLRMPALEDKRLMRTAFYAQRNHRTRQLRPEPLSDEQLRSIVQPTLMIQGAKSEMISPLDVKARVEALMPDVEVEVVPDAGHAVMLERDGSHHRAHERVPRRSRRGDRKLGFRAVHHACPLSALRAGPLGPRSLLAGIPAS